MKGLYKTQLFQDCDLEFIHCIASEATVQVLPENTLITTADVKSSWIHIIMRGYCILQSTMAGDREKNTVTVLKPGDAYPVVETLNEVLVLVNVKTITCVEIISISLKKLREALARFSHLEEQFSVAVSKHRMQNESLLLRRKGRLPDMVPFEKSMGQGDLFKYNICETVKITRRDEEYRRHFAGLGKNLNLNDSI